MAEGQDIAQMVGQMGAMTRALNAQGVTQMVRTFSGEAKDFRDWVKSIDKCHVLMGGDVETKMMIAYQTSSGVVSDFIHRCLNTVAVGDRPWDNLYQQLSHRFAEVTDEQHALALLRRLYQRPGESVPMFAERVQALAAEAFPGAMHVEPVQKQVIGYLIDGLRYDYLKLKIMRSNPADFEEAVQLATEEQNLRHKFALRTSHRFPEEQREEAPMEIDHSRRGGCFRCGRKHRAADCTKVRRVELATRSSRTGPVTCWHCGKRGHIRRNCPQLQPQGN